jgi:hypothetical protein
VRRFFGVVIILCAAVALRISGDEPRNLKVKVDFGELMPGTHYEIKINAEYVVRQRRKASNNVEGDFLVRSRLPASNPVRFDFTTPNLSGISRELSFSFPRNLPAPPKGMEASYFFPVQIRVSPPSRSGVPASTSEKVYSTPLQVPSGMRCFRMRGPFSSGHFFIGVSDCAKPIPHPPSVPDRPVRH